MVALVTCDQIQALIEQYAGNINGTDLHVKSMSYNATTSQLSIVVGETGNTTSDTTLSVIVTKTASNVAYTDTDWFLNSDAPTVQAALDQLSAFLSTAFGEDLVVLNNPTIYIRQATGSATPTIGSQADLTEANAFNNFTSMKTWLENTLVVGSITIDARGTFTAQGDIGSGSMKNAASITVHGDPNDPTQLVFDAYYNASTQQVGSALMCTSGGVITVGDCELRCPAISGATAAGIYSALRVLDGTLKTNGTVKLTGAVDASAAGINCDTCAVYASSSRAVLQLINTEFDFAYTAGHKLHRVFFAREGGSMSISGGLTFTFTQDVTADAVFEAQVACRVLGTLLPGTPPVFTSGVTGEITENCAFNLGAYAVYNYNGWLPLGAATWPFAGAAANIVHTTAVINGVIGG